MTQQYHQLTFDITKILQNYKDFMDSIPIKFTNYDDDIIQKTQEIKQLIEHKNNICTEYYTTKQDKLCEYFIMEEEMNKKIRYLEFEKNELNIIKKIEPIQTILKGREITKDISSILKQIDKITSKIINEEKKNGNEQCISKKMIKKAIDDRLVIFDSIIKSKCELVCASEKISSLTKIICPHENMDKTLKHGWFCKYCYERCHLLIG
jgi:hypothetical protein